MYYLYLFIILLSIYTDSPLQRVMGFMGFCITPIICMLLYFPMVVGRKDVLRDELTDNYTLLIKLTTFLSIIALIITLYLGYSMTQLGESLPVKCVKLIIINLSYVATLMVVLQCGKHLTLKQLLKPFFLGLLFITFIAGIEIFIGENILNPLHFGDTGEQLWDYNRVRLLSSESSHTTPIIEIFFGVSLYYSFFVDSSIIKRILTLLCGAFLIFTTGSKTLMVALFICLAYAYFVSIKGKLTFKKLLILFLFILLFVLACVVILPRLMENMEMSVAEDTTVATRSFTVFVGYLVGVCSVIGTGFQSYMIFYPYLLDKLTYILDYFMPDANMSELMSFMMATDDTALSAKSFFGQSSMYWGIVGTIYLVKSFWRVMKKTFDDKRKKGKVIFSCLTFLLLMQLLLTSEMSYLLLCFFALMILMRKFDLEYSCKK